MKLLHLLIALVLPSALLAQGNATGASYLKLPFIARLASMGESLTAEPGYVGSVTLNPANLLRAENVEIALSHVEWIQDLQSEYFAIGFPVTFGAFGLSISSTNINGIEVRDSPGPAIATFTAHQTFSQASFASPISPEITFGVSTKLLYEKIYVDESTGFAVDLGVLYHSPVKGLTVGASMTNLGSMSALAAARAELPQQARIGASYKFEIENFDFTAASQFTYESKNAGSKINVGLETKFEHSFALRLGYQSGYESRSFSAGFGVQYDWVTFDYAYVPFSLNLGTAHIFTLGFTL